MNCVPTTRHRCIRPLLSWCAPRAVATRTRARIPDPFQQNARVKPTENPGHPCGQRNHLSTQNMNREVDIADTPDGTKCYVWVHSNELAELGRYGSTTVQLRQLLHDSHHDEDQNEALNTALEHISGWTSEALRRHPRGWRRYALRWPT